MTELVHSPRPSRQLVPAHDGLQLAKLSHSVSQTDMVPSSYRGKPDAILACFISGWEVGLSPMESLRSFYIVDGKPSMSAELMHTLALRAGHDIWVSEASRDRCTVTARHASWPKNRSVQVTFDVDDADAAGLTGKGNWKKYRRAMLRSRAVSEAIRQVCPEVLVGATYTTEELDGPVDGPFLTPTDRTDQDWVGDADVEIVEQTADIAEEDADEVENGPPTLDDLLHVFDETFLEQQDLEAMREYAALSDSHLAKTLSVLEDRQAAWEAEGKPASAPEAEEVEVEEADDSPVTAEAEDAELVADDGEDVEW